jgi:hypothetical protein
MFERELAAAAAAAEYLRWTLMTLSMDNTNDKQSATHTHSMRKIIINQNPLSDNN